MENFLPRGYFEFLSEAQNSLFLFLFYGFKERKRFEPRSKLK